MLTVPNLPPTGCHGGFRDQTSAPKMNRSRDRQWQCRWIPEVVWKRTVFFAIHPVRRARSRVADVHWPTHPRERGIWVNPVHLALLNPSQYPTEWYALTVGAELADLAVPTWSDDNRAQSP